jgi:putative transposase
MDLIEPQPGRSIRRQCGLLNVPSGRWYAPVAVESAEDLELKSLLDEAYLRHPSYGSRRMTTYLRRLGWNVNRKRVQRLLREMGLTAVGPQPNTRRRDKAHAVYTYLLRDVAIERVNQVWSADISHRVPSPRRLSGRCNRGLRIRLGHQGQLLVPDTS